MNKLTEECRVRMRPAFRVIFIHHIVETQTDGDSVQVHVRDNNVDQALKALKKKMQREGIFREMKLRNYYEKPSEKRAREKAEAIRRARKLVRKRMQREGLIAGRGRR
jgi:small subunit ribosomal protein S21